MFAFWVQTWPCLCWSFNWEEDSNWLRDFHGIGLSWNKYHWKRLVQSENTANNFTHFAVWELHEEFWPSRNFSHEPEYEQLESMVGHNTSVETLFASQYAHIIESHVSMVSLHEGFKVHLNSRYNERSGFRATVRYNAIEARNSSQKLETRGKQCFFLTLSQLLKLQQRQRKLECQQERLWIIGNCALPSTLKVQ